MTQRRSRLLAVAGLLLVAAGCGDDGRRPPAATPAVHRVPLSGLSGE
jgi:hypothetical protein